MEFKNHDEFMEGFDRIIITMRALKSLDFEPNRVVNYFLFFKDLEDSQELHENLNITFKYFNDNFYNIKLFVASVMNDSPFNENIYDIKK